VLPLFAGPRPPVFLAPMEDVSDVPYRQLCRELGADVTVTEFVRAEGLVAGCKIAARKVELSPADLAPGATTAIQIYGANPRLLVEAAEVAADARPAFVDINCGCWVPRVARTGAGAAWLRDPATMVEMAGAIVRAIGGRLPVTVKTRIGWGDEKEMPIVELARRLEGAGVAAITVHCRTAKMGHSGRADWSWARRVREAVSIPVVVNGDVRSADDARRALDETGCAGVMIGRAAIDDPFVFREVRALFDRGERIPRATDAERLALYARLLRENVARRGPKFGIQVTRRHLRGLIVPTAGGPALRDRIAATDDVEETLAILEEGARTPLAA
jgi:nifR3 family TIM-barrel protein